MSDNEIKPVAWRWLDTCTFRKSIPKTATAGDWNPLYDQSAIDTLTNQISELKTMLSIAEFQRKEMQAERDAAVADAYQWQRWLPWLRSLNRKPFNLAKEIAAIDAARAKEGMA